MFCSARLHFVLLACFALSVLAPGCETGPKKIKVKGRVTNGGTLLKGRPPLGRVRVTFIPIQEGDKLADRPEAVVNSDDGTFTVPGSDNKGILPGKYRICVYDYDPFPTNDLLKGKFSEKNSPIIREITEGDQQIDLDLSKPQG